jgi:phosphatidylinositol kinase/protein kinase (PI-3  family)
MIGSNGQKFKILCKPHDDVRKDARLMEFTSTVDKLLLKDNETSKRLLRIKTYHVTPLNEDCGLIEWIDGAVPIRSILFKLFTAHGVAINWAEVKKLLTGIPEEKLLENFKRVKGRYFPILYEWFLEAFPEPSSWLLSRSRFSRSTAVMSMLGYILGLGDRHGENLLLLNQTGEVLHVDFDCLFDKGLELEMPERVPFRLTEQMVDALGAAGYEGVFRKSAEATLQLLRQYEEMLMTNLETFLHDPIVDWSVKRKQRSSNKRRMIHGLMAARSPEEALSSIQHKIKGIRYQESIPLSVSGQVEYLLLQATSDENLSKMYIGWAPFL